MGDKGQIDLATTAPFRIGALQVEPALRRVSIAGPPETLEPRVMLVLVALARAEGRIVSRDQLIEQCWDGRIVGEDSINRVISRLRKLAVAHGDTLFSIETISKVGYRLVPADGLATIAGTLTSPPLQVRNVRRLWLGGAVVVGLLLATLAAIAWPRLAAAYVDSPQVRLAGFDRASSALPVAPVDLRSELLAAFGTDSSLDIIADDRAAAARRHVYVLGGAIGGDAHTLHIVTTLTDEQSGTQVWTGRLERPPSDAAILPRLEAVLASQVVRCTLSGIAEQRRALTVRVVSLYAAYCGELWTDDANNDRVIDLARRVTAADPMFARGWSGLALAEALALRDSSRPGRDAMRQDAVAAAAQAIKLDPGNSEAYAAQAILLPLADFAGRDALHRKSIEVQPSDCGCEHQYRAVFLGGIGRLEEAAFEAKRAHDMEPLALVSTWRWADMLLSAGHTAAADDLLSQLKALWPDSSLVAELDLRIALVSSDMDRGLARAARMGSAGRDATLLFSALKAKAPGPAMDRFRALGADPSSSSRFVADGLAALGDQAAALRTVELMIERKGPNALLAIYDPTLTPARASPEFATLVERIGLANYWRTSGNLPDFCRAARRSALCAIPDTAK